MSTKQSTIDYILDQLSGLSGVAARKMFGEYALYCDGTVVALICDDKLFVKITEPGKEFVGEYYKEGSAYPGAKPSMRIDEDQIDNHHWLQELITITAQNLPLKKTPMPNDIKRYNASQTGENKLICAKLLEVISSELKSAESKLWHGAPVWFIDGNPVAGYSVRKAGVQLLFWSGQSFVDADLETEGKFKAAGKTYTAHADIKVTALRNWLKQAKRIQWDYKNIVKNKGRLNKIGNW